MSECIEVGNVCVACDELWPCRAKLTEQLEAVTAERDALRGWQAGQTHYVGCWREHRRCALTTIDFEAARREHAELALREAVAELNRLREGQDDERR